MRIFIGCISFIFAVGACTSLRKSEVLGLPIAADVQAKLDQQLRDAENLLETNKFADAESAFARFVKDWDYSPYRMRAKIGQARALQGMGEHSAALAIFHEVIEASVGRYPAITAIASYYRSFCFESLGDDVKTLSALKDAENLNQYLPVQIALTELPARFAAFFNQKNQLHLAREYFRKAESGMSRTFQNEDAPSLQGKARTYFLMGKLDTSHVDAENFLRLVNMLAITQIFLLRSIEINQGTWSDISTQELLQNYSHLWNAIGSYATASGADSELVQAEKNERKISAINLILKNIELLKPYHSPARECQNTKRIFKFLEAMTMNGQQVILAMTVRNPLTQDAQLRQAVKKDFTIKSEPLFEIEKGLPGKKSNKIKDLDPNLN